MTIKTHGRMFTDNTVGITQLAVTDGSPGQAIVTDGAGTMTFATVGAGGAVGSSVYVENIFTGDGTTTTFTLSTGAPYEESILTFIDGVAQPTSAFTLPTTTSITFSPAPGNGAAIRVCHLGIASSVADNSITGAKLSMGGDVAGDILYYNGTDYQKLGIGTAGQHLATNTAANAPEWVASLPAAGDAGNVLTSDGTSWASASSQISQSDEEILLLESTPTAARTGTWTKPTGVTHIQVSVAAGGGHGGQNHYHNYNYTAGGQGGIGGFATRLIDVRNITSIDYSIGRGGGATTQGYPNAAESTFFGATGTPTGPLTVTVVAGAITAITGGIGSTVTSPPLIFIEPNATSLTGRDGTGAVATAVVAGGQVTGITINNGGSGYVSGQVQAFYGIHATGGAIGAGGGAGSLGTPGTGHGGRGNLMVKLDNSGWPLAELGAGGAGEPATGGAYGAGGHGGIYIRAYK